MIPKDIYICHKTKATVEQHCVAKWQTLNPDYTIHAYGNEECLAFLKNAYGQLHVDIFNYIKDGPIRSDFWRVCILHKYGGVYADADIDPTIPIHNFLEKDVQFLTCNSYPSNGLNPQFIVSSAEHRILQDCMDTYIQYYTRKIPYEYWAWSITRVMPAVVVKYIPSANRYKEGIYNNIQIISQIWPRGSSMYSVYCTWKGHKVLANKVPNYDGAAHCFINHVVSRPRPIGNMVPIPFRR